MSAFTPYIPAFISPPFPNRRSRLRYALRQYRAGLAVFLVSLWLGIMWVAAIRPLNAPDEPAYLQAVMETRNKRMIPEIHIDFSSNPAGIITGAPGDPAALAYILQLGLGESIRPIAYENSQPPLYYMVAGPIAMLLPSDPRIILYMSRLLSALFGAGTVFFCWAAVRQLAPRQPVWAVAVAGVIALLPEFCFNNARAGNDSLVNCLGAAAFYVLFRGLRQPTYDPWMLRAGAVVGLALLAKLTAVALVPGVALAILFRAFQRPPGTLTVAWRDRLLRGARMAAGFAGAALTVCGWWLVRNMIVYGDPTGTIDINRFYHTALPSTFNVAAQDQREAFIVSTWKSFWGYFGWQSISMPEDFYLQAGFFVQIFFGLTALVAVGFAIWRTVRWWGFNGPPPVPAHVWQSVVVMAVVSIALVAAFVQYSVVVAVAAQGRYLFMIILPAALLFTGGLYALAPHRVVKVLALCVPLLWLAIANFVALFLVQ